MKTTETKLTASEELFLKKYGNKITASESWVIRFADEYANQQTASLKEENDGLKARKLQYSTQVHELQEEVKELKDDNLGLENKITDLKTENKSIKQVVEQMAKALENSNYKFMIHNGEEARNTVLDNKEVLTSYTTLINQIKE